MDKLALLKETSFGSSVAEDESADLGKYFVKTELWNNLLSGDIDVIFGPKGSGKSALFSELLSQKQYLNKQSILLVNAENPTGEPVFRSVIVNPTPTLDVFRNIWKLYFIVLIGRSFLDEQLANEDASKLVNILVTSGLLTPEKKLKNILKGVWDYVLKLISPESYEVGLELDPVTQQPSGIKGKITLKEPAANDIMKGYLSIDSLMSLCNKALSNAKYKIWIALDRLDVAFEECIDNSGLEEKGIKSLLRAYRDIAAYDCIDLKIFLRSDIWETVIMSGFREASHIVRKETIKWNERSLFNLLARRAIRNHSIRSFYALSPTNFLGSYDKQIKLLQSIFPDNVEGIPALRWIIERTRDGKDLTMPRDLIQLVNFTRKAQINLLEIGVSSPDKGQLFSEEALKDGIHEVSNTRLHQTLYQEHSYISNDVEELRHQSWKINKEKLNVIWNESEREPKIIIEDLLKLGVLKKNVHQQKIEEYIVGYIYRPALEIAR